MPSVYVHLFHDFLLKILISTKSKRQTRVVQLFVPSLGILLTIRSKLFVFLNGICFPNSSLFCDIDLRSNLGNI